MRCSECNKDQYKLANMFFKLCSDCNNIRLHGNKYGKQKSTIGNKPKNKRRKSLFTKQVIENKGLTTREKDLILYRKVFDSSDHKCENCGVQLNTEFYDDKGHVKDIFTYSHIVQKSIASEIRHEVDNINRLCKTCHTRWEFGDKTNMRIYAKNKKRWPKFFK